MLSASNDINIQGDKEAIQQLKYSSPLTMPKCPTKSEEKKYSLMSVSKSPSQSSSKLDTQSYSKMDSQSKSKSNFQSISTNKMLENDEMILVEPLIYQRRKLWPSPMPASCFDQYKKSLPKPMVLKRV